MAQTQQRGTAASSDDTAWTAHGLVAFPLAFYGALTIGHREVLEGVPEIWSVTTATCLAGAVMGGFLQLFRSGRHSR